MIMPGGMIAPPTARAERRRLTQFAGATHADDEKQQGNARDRRELRAGGIRLHGVAGMLGAPIFASGVPCVIPPLGHQSVL